MTSSQLPLFSGPLGQCRSSRDEGNYPWDSSKEQLVINRTESTVAPPDALAVISPLSSRLEARIFLPKDIRGITERRRNGANMEFGDADQLYSQFVPLEAQAGGRKHAVLAWSTSSIVCRLCPNFFPSLLFSFLSATELKIPRRL